MKPDDLHCDKLGTIGSIRIYFVHYNHRNIMHLTKTPPQSNPQRQWGERGCEMAPVKTFLLKQDILVLKGFPSENFCNLLAN